jgi:hypothetical protein
VDTTKDYTQSALDTTKNYGHQGVDTTKDYTSKAKDTTVHTVTPKDHDKVLSDHVTETLNNLRAKVKDIVASYTQTSFTHWKKTSQPHPQPHPQPHSLPQGLGTWGLELALCSRGPRCARIGGSATQAASRPRWVQGCGGTAWAATRRWLGPHKF